MTTTNRSKQKSVNKRIKNATTIAPSIQYDVIARPEPIAQHPEQWYQFRRRGIGGSDAAAVLGKSKYSTPYQVWLSKERTSIDENGNQTVDFVEDRSDDESREMGRRREPQLIQEYADRTGNTVVQPGSLIHPDYSYVRVNLDGLVLNDRIIECKTSRYGYGWGEDGTDDVPVSYYFQCQHGMMIAVALGLIPAKNPQCDLFVSIAGGSIRVYPIKGDPALWEAMLIRYEEFWGYVERNERPEYTTLGEINQMYQNSKAESVAVQSTQYSLPCAVGDVCADLLESLRNVFQENTADLFVVNEACRKLRELAIAQPASESMTIAERLIRLKAIDQIQKVVGAFDQESECIVKNFLGESEVLLDESGDVLCTWKKSKNGRENFDKNQFKLDHPKLYDKYVWYSEPTRRFLPK